jgi:ribosomal-protein-alanine N-acetyltransferase
MLKLQNQRIQKAGRNGDIALAYIIRPMEKGDIAQVTEIDREAFPTQWPPANYRQEMKNQLAYYIVVIDDSRTIAESEARPPKRGFSLTAWLAPWLKPGYARNEFAPGNTRQCIVGFSGIWMMTDEAHITNIAVSEAYRGRGIGGLLLIATIDLARELKASSMTLEVRASNAVAQNLYSKYGFEKAGIRKGYYLDNREDAILMSTVNINSAAFRAHIQELRESLARKLETAVEARAEPRDEESGEGK